MRRLRLHVWKVAFSAGCWLGLVACDTGAVGVESCQNIEYARCSAAAHCPAMFAIKSVDACKRFYRDHCLHGLPLASDPGPSKVNPCISAINALGDCAARNGQDSPGDTCNQEYSSTVSVCVVIGAPETIPECSFLGATATADAGVSTGGATSTGGSASIGGATGSGGASASGTSDATGGSVATP
jgi:hypothetical protein